MRIDFRVDLQGPLAIGSGEPSAFADDTLPRDIHGRPVIPSAALKGAARAGAALAGVPNELLERAFGAAATGRAHERPGSVLFFDAAAPAGVTAQVEVHTTVALTALRTARAGALLDVERLLPLAKKDGTLVPLSLHSRVQLVPGRSGGVLELGVALVGLAAVEALGGRVNRGWGAVQVALPPESKDAVSAVLEVLR